MKITKVYPVQCGSVGWALDCKLKGRWFNSQSRYMPVLYIRALVGVPTRGSQLMFLSLSSPLPSPLSKSKQIKSFKKLLRCTEYIVEVRRIGFKITQTCLSFILDSAIYYLCDPVSYNIGIIINCFGLSWNPH